MEILVAEVVPLRDGLLAIPNPANQQIIVEGDSITLLDAVNGYIEIPWQIKSLVHDILFLSRRFSSIFFHHVFREANFVSL